MTPLDIPPIVLLVEGDRAMLEAYARCLEADGLWVAGTTVYDELVTSAEELHPDVIITDAGGAEDDAVVRAVEAVKRHPDLAKTPLVVLMPQNATAAPPADVTLRKPVPPDFLVRRTRDALEHGRELRGRSTEIVRKGHALRERSGHLLSAATAIANRTDVGQPACPK